MKTLLRERMSEPGAERVATLLSTGTWTQA